MELRDALSQISQIRMQIARTEVFRGFRSLPTAFSGLLALSAATYQMLCIPDPLHHLSAYLTLWLGAAILAVAAVGTEISVRCWLSRSALARQHTWLVVSQFLPSLVAGGLLTVLLVRTAPQSAWMLPGLWAILYSLGVFATFRLLPPATFWIASFYLIAGLWCLTFARDAWALSPWAMGLPFGIGQLFAAAVLYWTLERPHGENDE